MDCVLDWLQQTGESASHNVALKITIGLKLKIRPSQISLCNLIVKYTTFFYPILIIIIKYCSLRNISAVQWTCQHKHDIPLFTSNIHIKQPVSTDLCCQQAERFCKILLQYMLLKQLSIILHIIKYFNVYINFNTSSLRNPHL